MSSFYESERRLLVFGPGWWTAATVMAALLLSVAGATAPWTPDTLMAWLMTFGLTVAAAAVVAAEAYRRRHPGVSLIVVRSQSFSGLAMLAAGIAASATGVRWRLDPPAIEAQMAGLVWALCTVIGVAAAAQLVTHTRRLIAQGQEDHARLVASERDAHLAELLALQQRLEPGLLMNAITAIAGRAEEAPRDAERAVEGLAAYLRNSLRAPVAPDSTLGEDIRRAMEYIDTMALAGVATPVGWNVDADVREVTIPSGTLRTFLDFAMTRCLRDAARHPTVTVRAYRHAGRFYLLVSDTAAPDPPALSEPEALSALRRRLGAPPQRRVRVETHVMLEVNGTAAGTTQSLMMRLDGPS